MTEQEAIMIIENERPSCGKKIEFTEEEKYEAYSMAIQALEKQILKKPRKTDSYRGVLKRVYAYVCPTCGNVCLEKYMNKRQNTMFCWNCGQKIDWSDEE